MNRTHISRKYGLAVLIALAMSLAIQAAAVAEEKKQKEATVIFYVACYDVGKAALKDLKGVKKVETGFKNHREIDKVLYDPAVITVEKMEETLKKAKTYRGTEE